MAKEVIKGLNPEDYNDLYQHKATLNNKMDRGCYVYEFNPDISSDKLPKKIKDFVAKHLVRNKLGGFVKTKALALKPVIRKVKQRPVQKKVMTFGGGWMELEEEQPDKEIEDVETVGVDGGVVLEISKYCPLKTVGALFELLRAAQIQIELTTEDYGQLKENSTITKYSKEFLTDTKRIINSTEKLGQDPDDEGSEPPSKL